MLASRAARSWLLPLALFATGCIADERAPVSSGGGLPRGGKNTPAPVGGDTDAGVASITGVVCPVSDLRQPLRCGLPPADGLDIAIRGGAQSVSAANGAFVLSAAGATAAVLRAGKSSTDVRPSLLAVDLSAGAASDLVVPVVSEATHAQLVAVLDVPEIPDSATVVVHLVSNGVPAVGAQLVAPAGTLPAFAYYDGTNATSWRADARTGTAGSALFFGVPGADGSASITATSQDGATVRTVDVPVEAGAVSFTVIELDR